MSSVISRIRQMETHARLKGIFENLVDGSYNLTSPFDPNYNCIAHAANESHRWWWPVGVPNAKNDTYWPSGVRRKESLEYFIQAFTALGYEVCQSEELNDVDISHKTLRSIEGKCYGKVKQILRREIPINDAR